MRGPRLSTDFDPICRWNHTPCIGIGHISGADAFMTTIVLDPDDLRQVVRRYQQRIAELGPTLASLNSGSEAKQAMRHSVHASALRGAKPSILEIGCGLADFYKYLVQQRYDCSYCG